MAAAASPVVAVVGPTGSGKSDLALRIAAAFGGEIVNCDSLQVYRHFDIGTAKLRPEDWRGIPHHLIGILEPDQAFTAGEFARLARQTLGEIAARGRLPVLAGGTGFYLRALTAGLFRGPGGDAALRARLSAREARRPGSLHCLLGRWDPGAAARIHPNDVQKTMRALEVTLVERRPVSELHAQGRDPLTGFRMLKIGLEPPREALYQRLNARSEAMFADGLVEETRAILAMGYSAELKPFSSVGYRQAVACLQGRLTLAEAVAETLLRTRQYAKRQLTWFHHEPEVLWYAGFGQDPLTGDWALEAVRQFLAVS